MKTNCYMQEYKWRQSIHTKCILCHNEIYVEAMGRQHITHWLYDTHTQQKKIKTSVATICLQWATFMTKFEFISWTKGVNSWLQTMKRFNLMYDNRKGSFLTLILRSTFIVEQCTHTKTALYWRHFDYIFKWIEVKRQPKCILHQSFRTSKTFWMPFFYHRHT